MVDATTQALKSMKDMPPWVALVIALVPMLGGGGLGLSHLDDMNKQLIEIQRTQDQNTFRLAALQGRIAGMTAKNREQDKLIKELELKLVGYRGFRQEDMRNWNE